MYELSNKVYLVESNKWSNLLSICIIACLIASIAFAYYYIFIQDPALPTILCTPPTGSLPNGIWSTSIELNICLGVLGSTGDCLLSHNQHYYLQLSNLGQIVIVDRQNTQILKSLGIPVVGAYKAHVDNNGLITIVDISGNVLSSSSSKSVAHPEEYDWIVQLDDLGSLYSTPTLKSGITATLPLAVCTLIL